MKINSKIYEIDNSYYLTVKFESEEFLNIKLKLMSKQKKILETEIVKNKKNNKISFKLNDYLGVFEDKLVLYYEKNGIDYYVNHFYYYDCIQVYESRIPIKVFRAIKRELRGKLQRIGGDLYE